MNDTNNIIFIDSSIVFFTKRMETVSKIKSKKFEFYSELNTVFADPVAVSLFNDLNENHSFKIILIDSWINTSVHKRDELEELFHLNDLKINLHEPYFLKTESEESIFTSVSKMLNEFKPMNYTLILDDSNKNILELNEENSLDYNHTIFVNENNGLSFNNINHIRYSLNHWFPNNGYSDYRVEPI